MNDKTKAGVIAGAILGVVIIVVALVGSVARGVGCCNCLLPIGGGILAVYLYTKNGLGPIQSGDGAVLGLIAGAVAAVMYLIIGLPLAYFISAAAMAAQFEQLRESGINMPAGMSIGAIIIVGGIVGALIYVGLATVGGLIGASIFGKNRPASPPVPPPPPINYGGPMTPPPAPPVQPPPPPPAGDTGSTFGPGGEER